MYVSRDRYASTTSSRSRRVRAEAAPDARSDGRLRNRKEYVKSFRDGEGGKTGES